MARILLTVLVLALTIGAAIHADISAADVGRAIALVGFGMVLVIAIRVLVTVFLSEAWRLLTLPEARPTFRECFNLRLVRDGVNGLLPAAQIGGDVVGARLLARSGAAPAPAAASVVADVFVQMATQFLFTLAGLLLLVWLGRGGVLAAAIGWGLVAAIPVLVVMALAQRRGFADIVLRVLRKLAGGREWRAFAAADAFYAALASIRQRRTGLFASAGLHLLAWLVSSAEVYVALHLMGHPVTIAEAIIIESLGHAVRSAAFAVPGAVGVQEGGYVLLCALFGVPAEPAIAMSLVKRVADLVLGIPGLLIWMQREWRPSGPSADRLEGTEK